MTRKLGRDGGDIPLTAEIGVLPRVGMTRMGGFLERDVVPRSRGRPDGLEPIFTGSGRVGVGVSGVRHGSELRLRCVGVQAMRVGVRDER